MMLNDRNHVFDSLQNERSRREVLYAMACLQFVLPGACSPVPSKYRASRVFRDSSIEVFGRISVEVIGHGPDILLIPGAGSSRAVWTDAANCLRLRNRLHLINVAGFAGETPRFNSNGEILTPVSGAILSYIESLSSQAVKIVGHSMGGVIALKVASLRPHIVSRLIIVEALPFAGILLRGDAATVANMHIIAKVQRHLNKILYRMLVINEASGMTNSRRAAIMVTEWLKSSDRDVVIQALYDMLSIDLRGSSHLITCPIDVIFGASTNLTSDRTVKSLYHSSYTPFSTVSYFEVENAKHFVMLDQPSVFTSLVDKLVLLS